MKKLFYTLIFAFFCLAAITASTSKSQNSPYSYSTSEENLLHLFYEHQNRLNNLEKSNSPLIICFSGSPGMGKTTVAKELEQHYSAVVISSDQIRALKSSTSLTKESTNESDYFYFLMDHLPKKNGMFILDMSIDRTYKELLPWASKNNIPVFIIQIELSKEEAINRIKQRNRKNDSSSLENIDHTFDDYQKFYKNVGIDFYLDNSGNLDLQQLYIEIDKKIKKEHARGDLVDQLKRVLIQEK